MLREDQCVEAACIKNQRVGVKTSELMYGIRPFYTCMELLPAWSLHFYAATFLESPSCNAVEKCMEPAFLCCDLPGDPEL